MIINIGKSISGLTSKANVADAGLDLAKKTLGKKSDWITWIIIFLGALVLLLSLILPLSLGIIMSMVTKKLTTGGYGDNPLTASGASSGDGALTYPTRVAPEQIAGCLDNWIKKTKSNSPLNGKGITFAKAGQKYNVNPAFLLAMGGQESSFATAWGSITSDSFNYASLTCGCTQKTPCFKKPNTSNPRTWEKYQSWEDAITRHALYIKTKYLDKNINTIAGIGAIYCGDAPDCISWNSGVIRYFNSITAACPNLTIRSSSVITDSCGAKIINIAQSQIGYKAKSGKLNKYDNKKQNWCASFTSWVYKEAGYLKSIDPGTISLADSHKDQLNLIAPKGNPNLIQPGDIFWIKAKTPSGRHVGIVESIDGDNIKTIEGNVGGNNGEVARRTQNVKKILQVARPISCK